MVREINFGPPQNGRMALMMAMTLTLLEKIMDAFIESIFAFVGKLVAAALISSSVLLFASEIHLVALKKAQGGSSRLSGFTASMTKTRLPFAYGGRHGAGKKSH